MQVFNDKLFINPIKIIKAFDKKTFLEAFCLIEYYKKSNFYLIGYIKYEAYNFLLEINNDYKSKLPLLYFEVYKKYQKYKYDIKGNEKIHIVTIENIDKNKYISNINQIKDYIKNGITYEVNYTYPSTVYTSSFTDFELFKFLQKKQKTEYNAFIKNEYETILSFSPELFFKIENNKITTKPMKGTIKRGKTKEEDLKNINFLKKDEKNKAENVMIVDLLRNDLSKISKIGTVKVNKLFEVETHPTVHQMTSTISAIIDEKVDLYNIFKAIFPCGSITGAPKISTIKVIKKLEQNERGIYCGAIGVITPSNVIFQVPIRTLYKQNKQKYYKINTGGAIVWDSTPENEWEETKLKKKFLKTDFELIETMKVKNRRIYLKQLHLKRIKKAAKKFRFKINNKLNNLIPKYDYCIMRILMNKCGKLKIEYKKINDMKTNIITLAKNKTNTNNVFLYYKTTNRMWYSETMSKIEENKIFDEIYVNQKNQITEGARSNIIIKKNNVYYTPSLNCGLLNGCFRQFILRKMKVIEKKLYIDDLKNADKIFCLNSIRGIFEVNLEL